MTAIEDLSEIKFEHSERIHKILIHKRHNKDIQKWMRKLGVIVRNETKIDNNVKLIFYCSKIQYDTILEILEVYLVKPKQLPLIDIMVSSASMIESFGLDDIWDNTKNKLANLLFYMVGPKKSK